MFPSPSKDKVDYHLRLLMIWTYAVLIIEILLPDVIFALCSATILISLAWLDLWSQLPFVLRALFYLLCLGGLLMPLRRFIHIKNINQEQLLRRLNAAASRGSNKASFLSLTALFDRNTIAHPTSQDLWALHQQAVRAHIAHHPWPMPTPLLSAKDPFSLRFLSLIICVTSAIIAGPHRDALLYNALYWRDGTYMSQARLDLWIDPPPYTGRPPLIVSSEQNQNLTIPIHSTLIAHSSDETDLRINADQNMLTMMEADGAHTNYTRAKINASGSFTLTTYGQKFGPYHINIIEDHPPQIEFAALISQSAQGELIFSYTAQDDYGIAEAHALLSHPRVRGLTHQGRVLIPPPVITLDLPAQNGRGEAQTRFDIHAHIWAGVYADIQLVAMDDARQFGSSQIRSLFLPQRRFQKPLARMLIEQRRLIAFSADDTHASREAISAFLLDPDIFEIDTTTYLNLKYIVSQLQQAKNDQDLINLVDFMWEMAVHIEDGALSDAAKELQAAEDALNQALKQHADPSTLAALMQDYQKALSHYLEEMARLGQDNDAASAPSANAQMITPQDIENLLGMMREKAEKGDNAGAQEAFQRLQNIMRHLQAGRSAPNAQQQQAEQNLNELDRLMREQQNLQDRTDDQIQSEDKSQKNAQNGQIGSALKNNQDELARRLHDLKQKLDRSDPSQGNELDQAERAMNEASRALDPPNAHKDDALAAQSQALEHMQKGLEALSKNLMAMKNGEGEGPSASAQGAGRGALKADPLGRMNAQSNQQHLSPFNLQGGSASQRAQDILQELRNRLNSPARPTEELNYLERLLKTY